MARQQRNDVDYFPHSVNHGKKMFVIRQKYKNDGYAVWFMLLEELGKANFHYLDLKNEVDLIYLSASLMAPESLIIAVIEDLIILEEFDKDFWEKERILYNPKFIESIRDAYKKRSNECINRETLIELLTAKGRINWGKSHPKSPISTPIEAKRTLKAPEQKPENPRVLEATKKIGEFFGISELRQPRAFIKIGNFVRYQDTQENLDFLAGQFTAYKAVKSLKPKYKHNWENYIGDPSESYENGAWNAKDWAKELEAIKQEESGKEAPKKDSKNLGDLKRATLEKIKQQQQL